MKTFHQFNLDHQVYLGRWEVLVFKKDSLVICDVADLCKRYYKAGAAEKEKEIQKTITNAERRLIRRTALKRTRKSKEKYD